VAAPTPVALRKNDVLQAMSRENVEVGSDTRLRTFFRQPSGPGIPNFICRPSRRGTVRADQIENAIAAHAISSLRMSGFAKTSASARSDPGICRLGLWIKAEDIGAALKAAGLRE
jgi:hypothetical protein